MFFAILDVLIYIRHPRLMISFIRHMGYWPRPALPRRYNEKYLWRKLFDHDPRFTECIDKLRVKSRVRERHPGVRLPEVLWEGDDPEEIPASLLSGNCVVKANHGCGWNVLVLDGKVDRGELNRKARKWMRRRYYGRGRGEWGYKNITPRLFVEEMMMAAGAPVDCEYKCYIAGGELIYVYVKVDRFGAEPREAVLDPDGNYKETIIDRARTTVPFPKPGHWDKIVSVAKTMGSEFDFVRCDLYEIDGEIWFSEYTFYSLSGYTFVDWPEVNERLVRAWDIRRSWFLTTPQKGWRAFYAARLKAALDAPIAQ
ncbi:MAG: hypothetical protein CL535_18880 [Ahrensia sp.]|nr:hypothetical protein [Ahrensia sp.]|tara:strand:- start:57807 stop:58742 length:936 start_codon:yes stop_codon:yes gene_type:complete